VIRVYDAAGNLIEMHEHKGDLNSRDFCSHHIALPAKTNSNDAVFVGLLPSKRAD
jgi:hypothetical protein